MARKRIKVNKHNKKSQDVLVVLVEGETEENYLKYVKSVFNRNIKVDITRRSTMGSLKPFLKRYSSSKGVDPSEIVLIYDLEANKVEHRKFINNGALIHPNTYLTQPCIEFHFLLHSDSNSINSNMHLSSLEAHKKLLEVLPNYKKGSSFDWKKEGILQPQLENAILRSTSMFKGYDDRVFSTIGIFIKKHLIDNN